MNLKDSFDKVAEKIGSAMGHPLAFTIAFFSVLGWGATGEYFNWSTRHSLFINTLTTIVTFLLGFLILNTANRSGKAEQLKLDELIKSVQDANNRFIKLEEKSSAEMQEMEEQIREEVQEIKSEDV